MLSALRIAGVAALTIALLGACSDRDSDQDAEDSAPSTTATPTTTGPSSTPTSATPSATATSARSGPASFEGERALGHIEDLASEIGPRVAGSDGETEAAEYISDAFEAAGYTVEVMEFEFDDDPYRPGSVEGGGSRFDAYTMSGSSGGSATGAAVFVGLAGEADVDGLDLEGKIAIAERGVSRFTDKWANVKAAGAAGLIVYNNESGELLGSLDGGTEGLVVGVTQEAGEALKGVASSGGAVTVETPAAGSTTSVNVIARADASTICKLLVGGHHDTVPAAPGAHDNASGTGAVLELARSFAADGLDRGLCFATFGAEESGLNGSEALAARWSDAGELPAAMVNLDTTGLGTLVELIGTSDLTAKAQAIADRMGIPANVTSLSPNVGSDHQSFERAGVPVIFFATDDSGNLHTPEDTFETIEPEMVEQGGDLAYEVIRDLFEQVAGS